MDAERTQSTEPGRAAPEWLRSAVRSIEGSEALDPVVERITPVAEAVGAGPRGDALRGRWLGHALHPLLTDLPLGCWIGAGLLDLVGGRQSRRSAQRLVGLGLLFVPPTAASGMADLSVVDEQRTRRVGAVHAVGNTMVAGLYLLSWRARRRGHHGPGVAYGMLGGSLAWVTGYLGGHLSFGRSVGVGPRGLDEDTPNKAGGSFDPPHTNGDTTRNGAPAVAPTFAVTPVTGTVSDVFAAPDVSELVDVAVAADLLMVEPEQIHAMVAGGLLVPTEGDGDAPTFTRAAVLAVRSLGG